MLYYGSELTKHKDRPSCEISATLFIASDKKNGQYMDGERIDLEPGDAAIYRL